jgi:hypothetical protein
MNIIGFIGLIFMGAYTVYAEEYLLIISMIWIVGGIVVNELQGK